MIVAVPARDEQALLGECLAAVGVAVDGVRTVADVHVVVAADRCADDTEAVAAMALARHHASIARAAAGNVGVARALAVAAAATVIGPAAAARSWIAMTDADSVVPPDWLAVHLDAAAAGADAVAGVVAVDGWSDRSRALDAELGRHHRAERRAGIRPVHGANLGVSMAALTAVGGAPPRALAEDVELIDRLLAAGCDVRWDPGLVVRTSARRSARAPGGFSSLLDQLEGHGDAA